MGFILIFKILEQRLIYIYNLVNCFGSYLIGVWEFDLIQKNKFQIVSWTIHNNILAIFLLDP